MKPWKKWALAGAITISLAASAYIYASARNPEGTGVKTVPVKKGDMSSILSSSGIVQSRNRKDYFVYSPTKIERIYVNVGDKVEANELLIKFEVPDLTSQLRQAYLQLDIAQATLDNLKKQKDEGETQKSVQFPGAGFDISGSGDIDGRIKIQEKQVEIARLNIKSLKDKINNAQSQIKSTVPGVVTGINGVEGSIANVALPVITVEDTGSIKAVLNVSQYDVLKLKEGQDAVIRLGNEQKEYNGRVEKINPTAKKVVAGVSAETSIPVDVAILNSDSSIRIGFDVDVDVKINSKSDVLYIPDEAIISDKDRNNKVYIVENSKARLKEVKVGLESDFYTEILSGILEGDRVILNPPATLKDGSQVRVLDGGDEK